jgi:hypothetical protein
VNPSSIPSWASDLIAREVDSCLQHPNPRQHRALTEAVRRLRAWPVYGDIGGTLLLGADGEVYCQDHTTMEARLEAEPGWRTLAWVVAAERVPELRVLLPERPPGVRDCPPCGGSRLVHVTPVTHVWCGACWGLGWERPEGAPVSPVESQ